MGRLTFERTPIEIAPGETVLAALLAAGVELRSSCRAGACQTCVVRATEGTVPAAAQQGLPAALKAQGYLMACVCVPDGPLKIVRAGDIVQRVTASVTSMTELSPTVVRLRLRPEEKFRYRSGQFLALELADETRRHYSIASHPQFDPHLELHVRLLPGGRMSRAISEELRCGDRVAISGPSGACYYEGVEPDQPLVLVGTGTGLAPLWGVLRDALWREHRGPIRLFHGARDAGGLYYCQRLRRLAAAHANFFYHPCLRDGTEPGAADLVTRITNAESEPTAGAFFICGNPDMVRDVKRTLFLKGAKLAQLRTDPFVAAAR